MESINQRTMKELMVGYNTPGLAWWNRKSDKFLKVHGVHDSDFHSMHNGLLDGPEARFFAVFLYLYRTGGMYVDLTTMMLKPLPEVYVIGSSVVTCHCLI